MCTSKREGKKKCNNLVINRFFFYHMAERGFHRNDMRLTEFWIKFKALVLHVNAQITNENFYNEP